MFVNAVLQSANTAMQTAWGKTEQNVIFLNNLLNHKYSRKLTQIKVNCKLASLYASVRHLHLKIWIFKVNFRELVEFQAKNLQHTNS